MENIQWTSSRVNKLYKLDKVIKSRQTLLNSEEKGEIPKAGRINRGRTKVRVWKTCQLPEIGKKFGFLTPPKEKEIITVYTSKGGVLKSTFSYNLARMLALNGIKVIIIGLDIQLSVTEMIDPVVTFDSLEDYDDEIFGLYHLVTKSKKIQEVIKKTDLPTLDYIPETPELNALEKKLRNELRREYFLSDNLIPCLSDYDVIIFDNSPSWSCLIENSLTAASHVLSPIACDVNSYRALRQHVEFLSSFTESMKINWKNFKLIPTLLEKTKLSQQIYGTYTTEYIKDIVAIPIRRSVQGNESSLLGISAIEYDPQSNLAQDYYELISDVWNSIIEKKAVALSEKS